MNHTTFPVIIAAAIIHPQRIIVNLRYLYERQLITLTERLLRLIIPGMEPELCTTRQFQRLFYRNYGRLGHTWNRTENLTASISNQTRHIIFPARDIPGISIRHIHKHFSRLMTRLSYRISKFMITTAHTIEYGIRLLHPTSDRTEHLYI